jgi:hypothetical protein
MPRNDFERLCSLYLRLNGFFLITNFTLHYTSKKKKTEEIDFVGVRFPNSREIPLTKNGDYDEEYAFVDDEKMLKWIDNSKITILLGEATMSTQNYLVKDRIRKLNDSFRTKYAMQRFGIFDSKTIEEIANGRSDKFSLLRIMFVLSYDAVPKNDCKIRFLSYSDLSTFALNRAAHISKASSISLLPEGLQDFVNFLRTLKINK